MGSLVGALDGAAYFIPVSLGSAALVFGRMGPDVLASGVFAVMVALAWVHFSTAGAARPLVFAARFFEATTLAAMLEQFGRQLPAWALQDTVGIRLALLCVTCALAGLWVGALYLARVDRFTRYIPPPVFAGFANSIAVVLLVSQTQSLWHLAGQDGALLAALSIAMVVFCTSAAVRRWRPRWPASACALMVGLVIGVLWQTAGRSMPVVSAGTWTMTLPFMLADFPALVAPGVKRWAVGFEIATNAAILGTMVFINTTLTAQQMTQADDVRRSSRKLGAVWNGVVLAIAGAIGAVPVSGSAQSSIAAARTTKLSPGLILMCAGVTGAVYLSGILAWIPLAALCGALLFEAFVITDKPSMHLLADWLRRRPMKANARADLALIAAVTACAVVFNMVAAVFVGLLLGLVLFAVRNASRPVRHVWTGDQLHSNCARARADLRLLESHGSEIKVFELEGDLFFAVADQLETELRAGLEGVCCAIIDWSRVRHVESGVAYGVRKIDRLAASRGIALLHAGADMQSGNVGAVLRETMPGARFVDDLDHAMEQAENHVVKLYGAEAQRDVTSMLEAVSLFNGLDDAQRSRLEAAMEQKLYAAGDCIVTAGDASEELMLVLQGSASIVVRSADGRDMRLAGVRRGATIGEIGFLDRAPRSATVLAQEDMVIGVLRRAAFDDLASNEPRVVQQLLANMALEIATRLRHTNRLAMARQLLPTPTARSDRSAS